MAQSRPTPGRDTKRKLARDFEDDAARSPCKVPKQANDRACAFLRLPRELRDEIYRQIVEDSRPAQLKGRDLITRCGLVGVNSQICEEYMDAVLFHSPIIKTTVKNHNFAHVVTFLNRLSEAQYKKIQAATPYQFDPSHSGQEIPKPRPWYSRPANSVAKQNKNSGSLDGPNTHKRQIIITLSYSPTKQSTKSSLDRWLDRFDDPNRRGADLDIRYEMDDTWSRGGYKQRPRPRVHASERWTAEARKITQASAGIGRGYNHF